MISLRPLVVLMTTVLISDGHKILFLAPMPTQSHNILATRLSSELANAGHQITIFTPFPRQQHEKNIEEVILKDVIKFFTDNIEGPLTGLSEQTPTQAGKVIINLSYRITELVLKSEGIKELLQSNKQFDVVIIYQYLNDGLLGIAQHLKAPVIYFSSMPLYAPESFTLAHPTLSSYAPNIVSPYTGQMTFWERIWNSIYDLYMISYYNWIVLPQHRDLVKRYVPSQPDLYNFINNISLIFINSHPSVTAALPTAPNAIEVGGFHIKEPPKMPGDLQRFLDNSDNGAILFSLGSYAKTIHLSTEAQKALINSFSKLKENILWKWEGEASPNLPKNIKQMNWIPQSSVLAHPNVKAFISHGGLLSTLESMHYQVPVIGIPIFVDQKMNIARAEAGGYAIKIPLEDLTEEKLSWALNEILNNPKYKKAVTTRSQILRDRPIKPVDSIKYWVDYVVRHQGAPHLRYQGMNLTWYQRHLLDVISFIVLVIAILLYVTRLALKRLRTLIRKTDQVKKKN